MPTFLLSFLMRHMCVCVCVCQDRSSSGSSTNTGNCSLSPTYEGGEKKRWNLASLRAETTLYSGGQVTIQGAQAASTYIHLHLLCPRVTITGHPLYLSQRLSSLCRVHGPPVRHCSNEHRYTRQMGEEKDHVGEI